METSFGNNDTEEKRHEYRRDVRDRAHDAILQEQNPTKNIGNDYVVKKMQNMAEIGHQDAIMEDRIVDQERTGVPETPEQALERESYEKELAETRARIKAKEEQDALREAQEKKEEARNREVVAIQAKLTEMFEKNERQLASLENARKRTEDRNWEERHRKAA